MWKVAGRSLKRRFYSSEHCHCDVKDLIWPKARFENQIDTTSPLIKIAHHSKHVLIETPEEGAHEWSHNQASSSRTVNPVTRAVLDAMAPGTDHDPRKPNVRAGKLLINQWSSCLHQDKTKNHGSEVSDIIVFPDGVRFTATASKVPEVLDAIQPDIADTGDSELIQVNLQGAHIYICAHLARDSRCGHAGPVLKQACEQIINQSGRCNASATISYINHMGGHKFAGNVLFYMPKMSSASPGARFDTVWYGRVNLENIEHIIHETFAGRTVNDNVRYATGIYNVVA